MIAIFLQPAQVPLQLFRRHHHWVVAGRSIGHYTLNGKKANIPSILVKAGDVVSVAEGSRNSDKIKLVTEANASRPVPQWLDADKNQLTAKVVRLPAREDVDMDIEEQQIVEFYSK